MTFTNQFHSFIDHGTRPQTTQALNALLDESRAALLDVAARIQSGEISMTAPTDTEVLKAGRAAASKFKAKPEAKILTGFAKVAAHFAKQGK